MTNENFDLAHFFFIGSRTAKSGERFLIEDKFIDEDAALCQLHDEGNGDLALFIMSGILNLDDQIILLLGSSLPEDREARFPTYFVVRVLSKNEVELVEEGFAQRIHPVAQTALELDRRDNQKLLAQVFGPFREYDPEVKLKLSMKSGGTNV
ncbi:MAG: hypothetical protein SGJ27_08350 [Candidatus Melainabacteria bacterium]|nr:hypothetical protein [Candidatus Melainabacteria bacterium]